MQENMCAMGSVLQGNLAPNTIALHKALYFIIRSAMPGPNRCSFKTASANCFALHKTNIGETAVTKDPRKSTNHCHNDSGSTAQL